MALAKIHGVAWADIAKVAGVDVANIAKVKGVEVPAGGCAAPVFRSAAEAYSTSTNSLSITKPSGVVSGDLLVAIINFNDNGTITPPSGWTTKNTYQISSGGTTIGLYYKIAGGSEPATYDWGYSATVRGSGVISCFSGSYDADPQEGAYSENEEILFEEGADVRGTSITTTSGCAVVLYLSTFDSAFGLSGNESWIVPSGWTLVSANDGTNNICVAYKEFPTAGATGDALFVYDDPDFLAFDLGGSYMWAFIRND